MKCRKIHDYDGTKIAGTPIGPVIEVIEIVDHEPVDSPREKKCVAHLSDGTWEFVWNLHFIEI